MYLVDKIEADFQKKNPDVTRDSYFYLLKYIFRLLYNS